MAKEPAGTVKDDVDRLVQVLAIARSAKLSLGAIAVGDIRLVFATPVEPAPESAGKKQTPEELELESLRKKSRVLFGKDMPDELLLQMKGAL